MGSAVIVLFLAARVVVGGLGAAEVKTVTVAGPNPDGAVLLGSFAHEETKRWKSAPRGTQVVDNVVFVCEGAIRTAGIASMYGGKEYPGAIVDVPVHRHGTKIHLLQASENKGGMRPLEPYARMVVHYASGEVRKFDFRFGVHGRDWMSPIRLFDEPVLDANTQLGWTHEGRNLVGTRFYHTTFENPLPKEEVTTIDFESTLYRANILVFGLAVDNDPTPMKPRFVAPENFSKNVLGFRLLDLMAKPVPSARLTWVGMNREPVEFRGLRPDKDGQLEFEFPLRALESVRYTASAPGYEEVTGDLAPDESGGFSTMTVLKMKKAANR
jgi:hypothetical protein